MPGGMMRGRDRQVVLCENEHRDAINGSSPLVNTWRAERVEGVLPTPQFAFCRLDCGHSSILSGGIPLGSVAGMRVQRFCFVARSSSNPSLRNFTKLENSAGASCTG